MMEARAALQPSFDCKDTSMEGQQPTGKSHRKKLIVGCSMVVVFGAAVLLGYFVFGPFVQHEIVDAGVHTQKFVTPGVRRAPLTRPSAYYNPTDPTAVSMLPDLKKEAAAVESSSGNVAVATGSQDFLEFEPYYDQATMPMNTYKPKEPYIGKVVSVETITGPEATGETCNIVIDHGGKMPYIEGQSAGVVPAGEQANGRPHKPRLYSIASSRYGDDMTGKTTTLCVRRATYWDPEMGKEDPAKKGICSNFLCDAKAGDEIKLTGPTGKVMNLPEDKPETDIIMVATGTGIAPYRSYWRRLFIENTPYGRDFKGLAWLFLGVANSDALLYDEEIKGILEKYPDNFRYDLALSREQKNKKGGKMYIQDKVEEYSDEIFNRLDKGAHIYFCGLKGMMPGIEEMLETVATSKGLVYADFIKKLKDGKQWHVEVY